MSKATLLHTPIDLAETTPLEALPLFSFQKSPARVKKELAAAKDVVESSRSVEEIEDEAWDTSMVAEYGDEIFQYMREA